MIPVLFYVGKRSPYPYSTRWLDEFDNPELAGKVYGWAYPLVDVTAIPDDEIMNHRSMAALTLLQKHIHQRDIATLTDRLTVEKPDRQISRLKKMICFIREKLLIYLPFNVENGRVSSESGSFSERAALVFILVIAFILTGSEKLRHDGSAFITT